MKPLMKDRVDWQLVNAEAKEFSLPPILIASIIAEESSWNTYKIRHEGGFEERINVGKFAKLNNYPEESESILQSCSFGLMQVMGCVARELGFDKDFGMLLDPEIGVQVGCKKLSLLIKKHGQGNDAIASYNAGSVKMDGKGKYMNQDYVNHVNAFMKELA